MSKLPAFQFYPGDWRKDIGVQSLSYHDRGVWFEMLCLMHESERRGKLILNGSAMSNEQIGRILGLDPLRANETVNVLLQVGVASREESTGALICRRMVRDQQAREKQAEAGKLGGNPALGVDYNLPGFVYAIRRATDGKIKIGISVNPSKRIYKLRYEQKVPLEMLATMATSDMGLAEAELHQEYAAYGDGEWFDLPPEHVAKLLSTLKGNGKGGTPSSSSSSSSSSKKQEQTAKAKPSQFVVPTWIDPGVWDAFEEMRKKIRAPLTHRAREGIVRELEKLCENGDSADAILQQSINAAYRGVFELKRNGGSNGASRGHDEMAALRESVARRLDDDGSSAGSETGLFDSFRVRKAVG